MGVLEFVFRNWSWLWNICRLRGWFIFSLFILSQEFFFIPLLEIPLFFLDFIFLFELFPFLFSQNLRFESFFLFNLFFQLSVILIIFLFPFVLLFLNVCDKAECLVLRTVLWIFINNHSWLSLINFFFELLTVGQFYLFSIVFSVKKHRLSYLFNKE